MAIENTSNTSSTINKGTQQYPYPSHVNAASFVSIKLYSKLNYVAWQEQMTCLVESHDMLGFIDGTTKKPEESDKVDYEARYREWKRSDALVKGWIYGSISEDVMGIVVGLQTANDVWTKLKTDYVVPAPISNATKKKGEDEYVPLCRAIQIGDWKKAQEFFNNDKDALIDKINLEGSRTLHLAIGNPQNTWFFGQLLDLIDPESLPSLVNNSQENALHHAAIIGNTIAAKKLVDKNPLLLFAVDNRKYLPIHRAIFEYHKTTALYLLQMCKQHIGLSQKDGYHNPFQGVNGATLLGDSILSGFLDVAYDLLMDYPELATTNVASVKPALLCIAERWDAYPSAKRYNFYQRLVYSYVPDNHSLNNKIKDIEKQETYKANLVNKCTNSYIYTAYERIYVKFWKVALLQVPHIKHLHEEKVKHNTTLMVLKFICEEVAKLKSNHYGNYADAFLIAVKNNTPEVIRQISQFFPQAVWTTNVSGYSLPQLSIMNRCEDVYNFLVHEVTHDKHLHSTRVDKDGNNLLHLAGQLAPTEKLNMITGAALQMQREIQWFQEVRKLVRPKEREAKNIKQKTPIIVFRKEHKKLRQEGEDWMKKTVVSYTITTALIMTIVFAASITVVWGNNWDTGKAIYKSSPRFIIFSVSCAISMFTSTTSLLMFLSILTSRYVEEDFLYNLPMRLILGLVMLLVSVATMMIAFNATLYIVFGHEKSWILVPTAAITCLPIASFIRMQLPLLFDLIYSTYGNGIFSK